MPLGAHICASWVFKHAFALFEWFPNTKSVRTMKLCIRLNFWNDAISTYFWVILPLKVVLKLHSGLHRQNFLGVSGPLNVRHNGQEGLWGSEIVEWMSQILLEYLGNDSKICGKKLNLDDFDKIVVGRIWKKVEGGLVQLGRMTILDEILIKNLHHLELM